MLSTSVLSMASPSNKPLHNAARAELPDVVRWLHIAARLGNSNIIKIMLEKEGADVDARNESGWTPLHTAANYGRVEAIKVLLEAGAKVNAEDTFGKPPLDLAMEYGGISRPSRCWWKPVRNAGGKY